MSDTAGRSFDDVFVDHRTVLIRTLARLVGSMAIAEDLAQETYLRVAAALGERPVQHLEPFLFQTARNLALDHLRAERRHGRVVLRDLPLDAVAEVPALVPSPEIEAGDRQLLARLDTALGSLTPRQQKVIVLARIDGWSQAEIAAHLGVSLSTVQKELKLAMAACLAIFLRLGGR